MNGCRGYWKKIETPLGDSSHQGGFEKRLSNGAKSQRAPRTNDRLADRAGLGSGRTLERGEKAIAAIDRLEGEGKKEAADGLRKVLNEDRNVTAAAELANLADKKNIAALEKLGTGQAKDAKTALNQVKLRRDERLPGVLEG